LLSDGIDDYEGETEAMGFERYGVPEVRRQVRSGQALLIDSNRRWLGSIQNVVNLGIAFYSVGRIFTRPHKE